jgi:hypothetical protein
MIRAMTDLSSNREKEDLTTRTELDILVAHIEVTLLSIIQGVALFFLADRAYDLLVTLQFIFWPYAATGLLIILIFWSRSLVHTLTVISWPLDLTHNFMYIACTLVECVTLTQLKNPLHWYALNTLFGLTVWVLFALDLRMMRKHIADRTGAATNELNAIVEQEQRLSIKLFMPATVIFSLIAAMAIWFWSTSLVKNGGHVVIALLQLCAALGYLVYVVRFFDRIKPLILKSRQEWRSSSVTGERK